MSNHPNRKQFVLGLVDQVSKTYYGIPPKFEVIFYLMLNYRNVQMNNVSITREEAQMLHNGGFADITLGMLDYVDLKGATCK